MNSSVGCPKLKMPPTHHDRGNGESLLSNRLGARRGSSIGIFRAISCSPSHGLVPNVPNVTMIVFT